MNGVCQWNESVERNMQTSKVKLGENAQARRIDIKPTPLAPHQWCRLSILEQGVFHVIQQEHVKVQNCFLAQVFQDNVQVPLFNVILP